MQLANGCILNNIVGNGLHLNLLGDIPIAGSEHQHLIVVDAGVVHRKLTIGGMQCDVDICRWLGTQGYGEGAIAITALTRGHTNGRSDNGRHIHINLVDSKYFAIGFRLETIVK